MEDKIKLFLEYVKKEKEITREYDEAEGEDVNSPDYKPLLLNLERIKAFVGYRNIRVEEDWYLKMTKGDNSRSVRERATELDNERSRRHSRALNSMITLNEFGKRFNLPKFYDGELLNSSEIESYKNISVRNEMTDFFLQFVDKISRTPFITFEKYFEEVGLDVNDNTFVRDLASAVNRKDSEYGVTKPFLHNEDTVEFKDDEDFDKYR